MSRWQVQVDTGGTFTDCVAVDPHGGRHRAKVLSHSALRGRIGRRVEAGTVVVEVSWQAPPGFLRGYGFRVLGVDARADGGTAPGQVLQVVDHDADTGRLSVDGALPDAARAGASFEVSAGEEAPVLAARLVTGTPLAADLPDMALRLATTRGTNALLERKGVPTALFVTRGFGDLLRIGDQQRPELFALAVRKAEPLCAAVVEVDERLDAAGRVLRPLSLAGLGPRVAALRAAGVEAAAVALLHSYRNPEHEERLTAFLRDQGLRTVSPSAALAPLIKILPRAQTAVVDAYLGPIIGGYLDRVGQLVHGTVHAMTSSGGLVERGAYRAKDSLLSGPAGGVAGAAAAGLASGHDRVLSFDMGGTSTDVARCAGDFEYVFEHTVGDARLVAPALAIETVAAGGGSICRYHEQRLTVGPDSAGADPGPACYGAGGPLTVTDVNLLLGRLDGARFGIPIDAAAARLRLDETLKAMAQDGTAPTAEEVLAGWAEVADERMAAAIRRVSLERGYDPTDHALVAFGGAGAQHACGVAARLGVDRVLVPVDASLLSARGLGAARVERFAERQVLAPLSTAAVELPGWLEQLGAQACGQVLAEGVDADTVAVRRWLVNLRFRGQESALTVDLDPGGRVDAADLRRRFAEAYAGVYGHRPQADRVVEVESMRVVAASAPGHDAGGGGDGELAANADPASAGGTRAATPVGSRRAWTGTDWQEVPVFERDGLRQGQSLGGPALVFEAHCATWVAPGWRLTVDAAHALALRHEPEAATGTPTGASAVRSAAARLELFTHALENGAREMGVMLQRTALSTNVKERLDFSCALLDAEGRLVVNAPHIPVHLGALGVCVRAVAAELRLGPGDTAITNHPGYGGSHLPDITLVTPVHSDGPRLVGYVASRAHHAEIGGTRPGSMPPDATCLAQEGVVIAPRLLVAGGVPRWDEIGALLRAGPHPSRTPADNLADLEAALAANHRGCGYLRQLAAEQGEAEVAASMAALRAEAARGVRAALQRLGDGSHARRDRLDDGTPLAVRIDIEGETARIDFTGTAGVHAGNLNATPAILHSAVIYALRLLVERPLPLNEGFLEPVEIVLPEGLLHPPFRRDGDNPAVVGGNVETSQRLVEVLLGALGIAAASQGTMNNTLFGNAGFGYYETICGGTGAGPGFAGADAVHSHMTNTRITDAEVVEARYPVRVERFAVRAGSGGVGRWRGGDGVVREWCFLEPVSLSVLTQHRTDGPPGADGGAPGQPGRQRVLRADGSQVELKSVDGCELGAGDRLVMETPGGGGWGRSA